MHREQRQNCETCRSQCEGGRGGGGRANYEDCQVLSTLTVNQRSSSTEDLEAGISTCRVVRGSRAAVVSNMFTLDGRCGPKGTRTVGRQGLFICRVMSLASAPFKRRSILRKAKAKARAIISTGARSGVLLDVCPFLLGTLTRFRPYFVHPPAEFFPVYNPPQPPTLLNRPTWQLCVSTPSLWLA